MKNCLFLIPAYNERENPRRLICEIRTQLPNARCVILDDGSDEISLRDLQDLEAKGAAEIRRSPSRRGKAKNLEKAFTACSLDEYIFTIDADVSLEPGTLPAMLHALDEGADLVVASPERLPPLHASWIERATQFSGLLQSDLRRAAMTRKPAFCVIGRCLAFSPAAISAVRKHTLPPHTEDAHIGIAVASAGLRIAYIPQAVVRYRAPTTFTDFCRQGDRFREGLEMMREIWTTPVMQEHFSLGTKVIAGVVIHLFIKYPLDGTSYLFFALIAAIRRYSRPASRAATWEIANSTKQLEDSVPSDPNRLANKISLRP